MKRARLGLSVLGLAGVLACGGRAIEEPGSGGSEPTSPAPTSTAKGGPDKSSSSDPLPSQALGACKPGFDRAQNPTRACHWLTESGICFDDTDSACGCICPANRNSVCAHGFDDGPNSATFIYCY
ncbi:MAG: hypothetical protein WDO74_33395 [Pseudomonadota bacterium]